MDAEGFIYAILRIMNAGISGLISSVKSPPGRRPQPHLLRISEFYNRLCDSDKQVFEEAMALASRQSFNDLLAVLDGSLAIEGVGKKGVLELYYDDGTKRIRINEPEQTPLNEIFRSF